MKKVVCLCLLVLLAAGACVGVVQWRGYVARRHDAQLFRVAGELLKNGRAVEAAAVIRSRPPGVEITPEAVRDWRELQVAVAARLHQIGLLLAVDERWPEDIAQNEDASLLVARARLNSDQRAETRRLTDLWLPKSARPETWFLLAADTLLAEKKRDEALALLQSRTFPGAADCGRLARLAILNGDDLKAAWNYLAEAYALDPRDADIRSFRAQILERIGKVPLARVEYIAAQQAAPDDMLRRDQLAEFYFRQGSVADALGVWTGDATRPVFDYMWVKAWFWSRVAHPARPIPTREDELAPLVRFLRALPDDHFWDADGFARISGEKRFARQRQETFWLALLENLRVHDGQAAAERLRLNRLDTRSWEPDLEAALQRILSYRATGALNPPHEPSPVLSRPKELLHSFFVQLDELALAEREKRLVMPPDMDRLLRGDEAFAAAFLAAGWTEAALRLRPADGNCDALPPWVAYGFTQALRMNRGDAAAIAFAEKQRPTPELDLVLGEAQLAAGKTDEGTARLTPLAPADTDVGYRAAWLLARAALTRHRPADAAAIVVAQPRLASGTAGRELLARVVLAEGRLDDADKAYAAIAADSAEAKTFLARRAYARKDWADARRYTDELLTLFPDQLQLRANLDAIDKAEHAGS